MGEYYGVVRAPNYLSHAVEIGSGGGSGVYKNHKYIARAMTPSGKYRYFYSAIELGAYKQQRMKQKNSLTKTSDNPAGPTSSQSKSLREKWEERSGLLSSKGGSGSGGSGRSGGSGKGSGGSGGSGGRSSVKGKVINAVTKQPTPKHYGHLSAGALKYQGDNGPDNDTNSVSKKKNRTKRIISAKEAMRLAKTNTRLGRLIRKLR